jgi:hypothetical protein
MLDSKSSTPLQAGMQTKLQTPNRGEQIENDKKKVSFGNELHHEVLAVKCHFLILLCSTSSFPIYTSPAYCLTKQCCHSS